jgi:hypothetical protein
MWRWTPRIRSVAYLSIVTALAAATACSSSSESLPTAPPSTPGVSPSGVKLAIDSASNLQTAMVGTPISVTAHLTNADGSAATNQTVTWSVTGGAGKVSSATSTTDTKGAVSVAWTLDTLAGTNQLTATITGVSVLVYATGTSGPLAALRRVSPDSQIVVSGASLALVVKSVDKYGNPVGSVPVTWSASGGALTPTSTTSGTAGNATVTFTADAKPAKYTITATTGTLQVAFALSGI